MSRRISLRLLSATAIGYLSTAAVVAIVPILLMPANTRTEWFWYRLAWAEFLTLLSWLVIGYLVGGLIPVKRSTARTGILPILTFAVIAYSLLSIVLMILSAYLFNSIGINNWHLITQIILTLIFILLLIALFFTRQSATVDAAEHFPGETPLNSLITELKDAEDNLTVASEHPLNKAEIQSAIRSIKLLRELLEYSHIIKSVRIDQKSFSLISAEVQQIVEQANYISNQENKPKSGLDMLVRHCRQLQSEINSLASSSRRSGST